MSNDFWMQNLPLSFLTINYNQIIVNQIASFWPTNCCLLNQTRLEKIFPPNCEQKICNKKKHFHQLEAEKGQKTFIVMQIQTFLYFFFGRKKSMRFVE